MILSVSHKYAIIDAFILIDYTKPPKYYSKPPLAMINKHGSFFQTIAHLSG